jgi:hypothetical protein
MITIPKPSPSPPIPATRPVVHPPVEGFHLKVSPALLVTDARPSFRSMSFQAAVLARASTSTSATSA